MREKNHLAIYGNVKMLRVYCEKCKSMTLVVDSIKLCCNKEINNLAVKRTRNMISGGERKRPNKLLQKKILEFQGNKCLYCNQPFGTTYIRNNKILFTRLHFDHLIPFSYSRNNKDAFVAACNICNGIKSNKMFNTVEEVFYYVKYNREKKGIKYLEEENHLPAV